MCDQQSLKSACPFAQSDQSLCQSLEYSMSVKLLTEHHLEFLSLKVGCRGSFESTHVKMPHCWKSHVLAQLPSSVGKQSETPFYLQFKLFHSIYPNKETNIVIPKLSLKNCMQIEAFTKTHYHHGSHLGILGETPTCIKLNCTPARVWASTCIQRESAL